MNGIDGLNVPHLVQFFCECFAQPVIINSHKGFTFLSDQFQKPIVVRAPKHRDLINLGPVEFLVIIQEPIHLHAVELEYIERLLKGF